jgi:glycosyltransferase involved in cell wall biosynthesis
LPLSIPHYFSSNSEKEKYKKSLQKSIDRADLIITNSNYSKQQIISNFDLDVEPEVIYHGIELLNESTINECNFRYFLYVGGYDPRKGIEKMLKIFLKLHDKKELESKLVLTGAQHYFSDSFKNLVLKGVNKGIIIEKGYVSESELFSLYSNAIALVYPSKYEGFGLPPLEAMSVGCPVITTKCTSIPEVCGDAAYYINVDDEIDFSNALIELENNQQLRNELINKGKAQASQFSWTSTAKLFLGKLREFYQ